MDTDDASISQSNRRPHASGMFLYLLPLFELILGAFFLGMLVSHIQQSDLEEQRHRTDVSCMTYTVRSAGRGSPGRVCPLCEEKRRYEPSGTV